MSPQSDNELEAVQRRLRRLATEVPLDRFLAEANAALDAWDDDAGARYGPLAESIGDALSSAPYSGDARAQAAAWKIAAGTIARKEDAIPVPTAIRLLYQLASEPLSGRSDWPAVRAERARWWLQTWSRLDRAIDPNFNPEQLPSTAPDPAAAAAAHAYNDQFTLRQIEPLFRSTAAAVLAHLYEMPPEQPEEWQSLLAAHVSDTMRVQYFGHRR